MADLVTVPVSDNDYASAVEGDDVADKQTYLLTVSRFDFLIGQNPHRISIIQFLKQIGAYVGQSNDDITELQARVSDMERRLDRIERRIS